MSISRRSLLSSICLVFLLAGAAQASLDRTYPASYKPIMENPCVQPWKDLPVGTRRELKMCGTSTGDQVAILSSTFMTFNARVRDPEDKLFNLPLTPDRVDSYLLEHDGYWNNGNSVNWNRVNSIMQMENAWNATFNDVIDGLENGSAYAVQIYNEADSQTNKLWGLLESVVCHTTEVNDQFIRDCSYCAKVNLRSGTESLFCSHPVDSYKYKPNTRWYDAYKIDPQQKEQAKKLALF